MSESGLVTCGASTYQLPTAEDTLQIVAQFGLSTDYGDIDENSEYSELSPAGGSLTLFSDGTAFFQATFNYDSIRLTEQFDWSGDSQIVSFGGFADCANSQAVSGFVVGGASNGYDSVLESKMVFLTYNCQDQNVGVLYDQNGNQEIDFEPDDRLLFVFDKDELFDTRETSEPDETILAEQIESAKEPTATEELETSSYSGSYLAGEISVFNYEDTYLGCWSCNAFESDSIHNEFGIYGSSYGSSSILNSFGHGSSFKTGGACNPYTLIPPQLVDVNLGLFYGSLSVNPVAADGICNRASFFYHEASCALLHHCCE